MLYPLTFEPIFKERVWGGRKLAELYGKALPIGVPIGESWEISDRPGDVSRITNGAFADKDLHWLVETHGPELLGSAPTHNGRFPLLIKILDAREKLSLQVHPPPEAAAQLGGEPKTEMWYIADAEPGAELYVGLKRGVTRSIFKQKIETGEAADCIHRLTVRAGDAMFLPSGRVHAIGGGLVIFEIQQNSDTTYRVFDWNRAGLDGKPRALHVEKSLASINFEDFEPALVQGDFSGAGPMKSRSLARDDAFQAEAFEVCTEAAMVLPANKMQILAVMTGAAQVRSELTTLALSAGQFCLIPAALGPVTVDTQSAATLLRIEAGSESTS